MPTTSEDHCRRGFFHASGRPDHQTAHDIASNCVACYKRQEVAEYFEARAKCPICHAAVCASSDTFHMVCVALFKQVAVADRLNLSSDKTSEILEKLEVWATIAYVQAPIDGADEVPDFGEPSHPTFIEFSRLAKLLLSEPAT